MLTLYLEEKELAHNNAGASSNSFKVEFHPALINAQYLRLLPTHQKVGIQKSHP